MTAFLIELGVAAAEETWTHRKAIRKRFLKTVRWFTEGKSDVAVFGAGGVGKSRLGYRLQYPGKTDLPPPYREDLRPDPRNKWPDRPGTVLILPGQKERDQFWSDEYQNLARRRGIINVVAWGLHSFSQDSWRAHPDYLDGMTKEQFVWAHQEHCRQIELARLNEMKPHLQGGRGNFWMVTVVAKQDLWWAERDDVQEYYTSGQYANIIEEIRHDRGRRFQHEYVSAALELNNWSIPDGEFLLPTASGYSLRLYYANLKNLVDAFDDLIRWRN
jgi:hypothetical protein